MATPTVNIRFVFETDTHNVYDIPFWANNIDLIAARSCEILDIDHRKATSSLWAKNHEFLHIKVLHRASGSTLTIAVDRTVKIPTEPPTSTPSTSSVSINNVVILSPSSSEPISACDCISFLVHPSVKLVNSESLTKFTFSEPRPTMLDLCGVLYILSNHAPKYHPYEFQCFWYAGTAFDVFTTEFGGTSIPGKVEKRCKWGSIPIPADDSTEEIRQQYRTNWPIFLESRNAAHNHKAEEARQDGINVGREEGLAEGIEIGQAASAVRIQQLEIDQAASAARIQQLEISQAASAAEVQRLQKELALARIADLDTN